MALRIVLALVAIVVIVYTVKPHFQSRDPASNQASCPCNCDCDEDFSLSFPIDCGNGDPDIHEEMQKDIIVLLSEEIALQGRVANDSLEHAKALVMDAKRSSIHYEKEAEKCNSQTEICEGAQEKAEAELVEEFKLSAVWEKRARELGWEDRKSTES